jgi:murein DD-endopeptidase MepM/ murein hydrolase activator NlpD
VAGVVVDPFRQPPCPFCAGNRGIDYAVDPGTVVRHAAPGRVEFAGTVAGTRYVVVSLANGWRLTYGQLTEVEVDAGDAVLAGGLVGRASGTFSFGLRVGDEYVDPEPFIGRPVTRPRLVPVDGTPPRPASVSRVVCPAPAGAMPVETGPPSPRFAV